METFSKVCQSSDAGLSESLTSGTGKRLWLKPGQRYLFGRVKKDGVRFLIEHKSISRKHFVIEVDKVKDGDAAHIHVRSKVTITDLNSKGGTHLDGQTLKDTSQELTKAEHSVKPGSYPTPLRLIWKPVVLTFSFPPKEEKNKDPLKPKRDRLEQLDIKTVAEYITKSTSHVVASKRNTVKGLLALISGQYIVDDPFIDALVYVATPADLGEEENLSPLEQDFDAAWPTETDFLPKAGKEPTIRPDESYAPNPSLEGIFEGYTFVFVDQSQFDLLSPVINAGHGKALLFNVAMGQTTVDEAILYMRNAAGEKGFGDSVDDTENGGVVMVRFHKVEGRWKTWFTELLNGVSYALDQRSIDQAQFIDAILANDATLLRQSLEFASTVEGKVPPPPTAASFTTLHPPLPSSPPRQTIPIRADPIVEVQVPSSPPEVSVMARDAAPATQEPLKKRSRLRGPAFKRKAFDDEFDPDSVTAFDTYDDGPPQDVASRSQASSVADSRFEQRAAVKEEPEISRKRRHSTPGSEDEEDMVDELLPAATAMKRRKLEIERQNGISKATAKNQPQVQVTKPKREKKEIDVREAAKQQREAEEEAERKERERLDADAGEVEHVKPANVVVIEKFELPVRAYKPRSENRENSDRWDPAWNGRKNFKGFRRQGDKRPKVQKVIVPLVEAKGQSYGIGEQYWDHSHEKESKSKKKHTVLHTQSQSQPRSRKQTQTQTQEEDEHASPNTMRLQQEAEDIVGPIDVETPRRTRLADKKQSQNVRSNKRPASGVGLAAVKKQKTIPTKPASDDSDSDSNLKFRFGRRNKA